MSVRDRLTRRELVRTQEGRSPQQLDVAVEPREKLRSTDGRTRCAITLQPHVALRLPAICHQAKHKQH